MSLPARVIIRCLPFRAMAALALALVPQLVPAQPQAPPPPANFFTDTAGVVPADAAARIEQRLREFEKASSNQVLVVVADRVPEGYASLEEYTNRTAEAWRVGDKSRDNGAVLFVFVGDRKVRIEVGYGLEGALPDALASRIINDEITPRFREGKYADGVLAGVEAIILATRGEYQPVSKSRPSTELPLGAQIVGLVVVLGVGFLVCLAFVLAFMSQVSDLASGRTYSGRGTSKSRRDSGWGSGGGWSSGGRSSWGGGGGFSGGGGSFGGGGASGSW